MRKYLNTCIKEKDIQMAKINTFKKIVALVIRKVKINIKMN